MSFVDEATVTGFVEMLAIEVSDATAPERPIQQVPFPRFTYEEVIERFGTDKPDLRFGMELIDLAPALVDADGRRPPASRVFDSDPRGRWARQGDRRARAWPAISRREIDELTERAKRFGARGLAHLSLEAVARSKGPIVKFLGDDTQRAHHRADAGAEKATSS